MRATLTAALIISSSAACGSHKEGPARELRLLIATPEKSRFNSGGALPMISPDGKHIAFAPAIDGQTALWLRDLDGQNLRMLPGTSGAAYPFWSPDSRWVAFFTDDKLMKIDLTAGPAQTVCDAIAARGGSWAEQGARGQNVIVYGNSAGLFRVPATGGAPVAIATVDVALGEGSYRAPWFLPGGKTFLYTARHSDDPAKSRIYLESIDATPSGSTRREILAADSNAAYVEGLVLFVRDSTLIAQPFDPVTAKTTGPAVSVAALVDYFPANSQGEFSVSRTGTLVYTSGAAGGSKKQTMWFDRTGKPTGAVGAPENTASVAVSPDGSFVATDPRDASGTSDIWLHDLTQGATSRFTQGPRANSNPVWSPDSRRIVWYSGQYKGPRVMPVSGKGTEEALDSTGHPEDWSSNGQWLIESRLDPKTGSDIWAIPVGPDAARRKPFPYLNSEYAELSAKLSPDGRWLAYVSDESNRREVYVQSFPEHGDRQQVSIGGGSFPVWSRDGRELYFVSTDRRMMAVKTKTGSKFKAGAPVPLFDDPGPGQFDVSKDGRFLLQVPVDDDVRNVPLTVVLNWQAGLKK